MLLAWVAAPPLVALAVLGSTYVGDCVAAAIAGRHPRTGPVCQYTSVQSSAILAVKVWLLTR